MSAKSPSPTATRDDEGIVPYKKRISEKSKTKPRATGTVAPTVFPAKNAPKPRAATCRPTADSSESSR
jgi:hypothetical protein